MRFIRAQAAAVSASVLVLTAATAANAQGWTYNPYTGGATWQWVARSLMWPISRVSSYNAPYFLANSLIWNGSYAANAAITNKRRNALYGTYYDPEPYYNPRQRTRPGFTDPEADQIAQAIPLQSTGPITAPALVPPGVPTASPAIASAAPPGAPIFAPPIAQPFQQPAINAPLAQGFIDHVNQQFGGDLSKALFDPQTRSYGRAVGLVDSDRLFTAELSTERIELMKQILSDKSETALAKIQTLRMLLKH